MKIRLVDDLFVMDLKSESNLNKRLEVVLAHHNAIRKGLGKNYLKKKIN
jgi:hypothetical protein